MATKWKPEAVVLDDWAVFLKDTEANVCSQFGEDGLICQVFKRVGTENRWCFECGAADGIEYSNTKVLREAGWSAILMERNGKLAVSLKELAATEHNSRVVGMQIDRDLPLDDVLQYADSPFDLDFGVIDVDGQDWWLWHDMSVYTPRVMLVEYAYRDKDAPVPTRASSSRNGERGQAGLDAIIELGTAKGYRAVAMTPCNVLFVLEDVIRESDAGQ